MTDVADEVPSGWSIPDGHLIQIDGTGFFSRGTCTGCDWTDKGHPAELKSVWSLYHGGRIFDEPPRRVEIPPPSSDAYMAELERQIIFMLCHHVKFYASGERSSLFTAMGLAHARWVYVRQGVANGGWSQEEGSAFMDGPTYVSTLVARIAHLHPRQQEKLRHPARDRREQQTLLEGGNL